MDGWVSHSLTDLLITDSGQIGFHRAVSQLGMVEVSNKEEQGILGRWVGGQCCLQAKTVVASPA